MASDQACPSTHQHVPAETLRKLTRPIMRWNYPTYRVGRMSIALCIVPIRNRLAELCRKAYQLGGKETAERAMFGAMPSSMLSSSSTATMCLRTVVGCSGALTGTGLELIYVLSNAATLGRRGKAFCQEIQDFLKMTLAKKP